MAHRGFRYYCSCGSNSFSLVDKGKDIVLACKSCKREFYISPCNTNGLCEFKDLKQPNNGGQNEHGNNNAKR